jgi:putative tricarboxylic transport membrane protein
MPRQLIPGRTTERENRTLPAEDPRSEPVDVEAPQDGRVEVTEPDRDRNAVLREVIPELVLLGAVVYLFIQAGDFSARQQPGQLGPAFWPRLAAIGLAVGLLVRIVQVFREHNRPVVRVVSEFDDIEDDDTQVHWRSAGIAMGLAFGYVVATMFLGYMFATMAFLGGFIWAGGQRKWVTPVVAVGGGLIMTYVFVGVVYVSVPTGVGVFDTVTVAVYRLLGIQ